MPWGWPSNRAQGRAMPASPDLKSGGAGMSKPDIADGEEAAMPNVSLTPELEGFAETCVAKGRYGNVSEVMRAALQRCNDSASPSRSKTTRTRRLVCSSRCVTSQMGKTMGAALGSTRRTRGSASPIASVVNPMPASCFTSSQCTKWLST